MVGDPGGSPAQEHAGDAARAVRRGGPRHLSHRIGLLRHQRRRYGCLRRGAALPGCRPAGSRPAVTTGRNGVGELRPRLCDRPKGWRWRLGPHSGVGLRGVVSQTRRATRARNTRQHRDRRSCRLRARGANSAKPVATTERPIQKRQQRRAPRMSPAVSMDGAAVPARCEASGC